jgi:aspartate aminotransferase
VLSRDELKEIAKIVLKYPKLYVLSDEVYSRFCYDTEFYSIASLPRMLERTIIMDGLSKTYAMTGWRFGFATGNPEIIKSFSKSTTNLSGCANHMTQYASIVALGGSQEIVKARIDAYRERRDLIVKLLNEVPGVHCLIPGGAC